MSIFVLADDGVLYEDPVIGEKHDWFLHFDATDPPEIVVRQGKVTVLDAMQRLSCGVSGSLTRIQTGGRSFPPFGLMFQSESLFCEINEPIPTKFIMQHGGAMTVKEFHKQKEKDCVVYHFGKL